jgi:hypothetical protein
VKVFVTGVMNANCNEPFFMSRLHETIKHYSVQFDTLDVVIPDNFGENRLLLEKEIIGREILNIIACEGAMRVERHESYKCWQRCIQRFAFKQKRIQCPSVAHMVDKSLLASYDKRFGLGKDDGWFLMGWKNEIVCAFSAWEPIPLKAKHFK